MWQLEWKLLRWDFHLVRLTIPYYLFSLWFEPSVWPFKLKQLSWDFIWWNFNTLLTFQSVVWPLCLSIFITTAEAHLCYSALRLSIPSNQEYWGLLNLSPFVILSNIPRCTRSWSKNTPNLFCCSVFYLTLRENLVSVMDVTPIWLGARFSRSRKDIEKSQTLWSESCFIHEVLEVLFILGVSGGDNSPFLDTDEQKMALGSKSFRGFRETGPRSLILVTYLLHIL